MESRRRSHRTYRARALQALDRQASARRVPSSPVEMAQLLLDQLALRDFYLPGATFEDPQWLMTLELFIATEEGRPVTVSGLCGVSGVPSTTALRHIQILEAAQIFVRARHPRDRRITHIRLSDRARLQIARYLMAIAPPANDALERPLRAAH